VNINVDMKAPPTLLLYTFTKPTEIFDKTTVTKKITSTSKTL
jgi:hypothetical protein